MVEGEHPANSTLAPPRSVPPDCLRVVPLCRPSRLHTADDGGRRQGVGGVAAPSQREAEAAVVSDEDDVRPLRGGHVVVSR